MVSDLRMIAAARLADESGCDCSKSGASAPACTGAVGSSGASLSSVSTTSATTTVMLSGPPERSASSMSRCDATSGVPCPRATAMVSGVTGSDRPSEHRRTRSPGWVLIISRCGSTGRPVYAFKISDFCGWLDTSAGLSLPSLTSDWTNVSSSVIWVSVPSRSK